MNKHNDSLPQWQMLVPGDDTGAQAGRVGFPKDVGFSPFRIVVGMGSKEGVVGTGLKPSGQEFFVWVAKETPGVAADERKARHVEGKQHRHRDLQMVPLARVVARPNGAVPVRE